MKDEHRIKEPLADTSLDEPAALYLRIAELEKTEAKRQRTAERLAQVNECFLSFGRDAVENINSLTALCGELLGATCALYNRLDQGMLCSTGQWRTSPDYNPVYDPEGHICYDFIKKGGDEVLVIRDLAQTPYAQTYPNVTPYQLKTYVGKAVKRDGVYVGSLCVVFQEDFVPSEEDKRLMGIIAAAVGVEESRRQAVDELEKHRNRLEELVQARTAELTKTNEHLEQEITERVRVEGEVQRRMVYAALTYQVGQRVSGELDLDGLSSAIVKAICEAFDYYSVGLLLTDEDAQCVRLQALVGGYVHTFSQDMQFAFGEGMIGQAAGTGETQISGDITQNPHYVRVADEETRSELALPIKSGHKVVGVLDLQSKEFDAFDEIDVLAMETLGTQVATVIENAHLFEETQKALEETEKQAHSLALLNRMGEQLSRAADLDGILAIAAQKTAQILVSDRASVSLLSSGGDYFHVFSLKGAAGAYPIGTRVFAQGQPMGEAVRKNCLVVMNDVDPETLAGVRSYVIAPLFASGRALGALNVGRNRPNAFTLRDQGILLQIASLLSSAIANRRLFEEARTRADELAVLNELGQALTARLDVDQVMKEAYRGASQLLDTSNFNIALYDPGKNEVHFAFDVTESEIDRAITTTSVNEGLTGYIIRNRTNLLIREGVSDRLAELGIEYLGEQAQSWMAVPLVVGDRVLGAMSVQSYTIPHAWDEHDLDLLTAIASQTAIALQNARLYEAVQQELVERKRADEALWESEKRFRSMAETASDAVIIFNGREHILFWNRAALRVFGYEAGETLGELLSSILPQPFYKVLRVEIQRVLATGQSDLIGKAVEVTGVRKDGAEFPLELTLTTWSTRKETFFTAVARDITGRKSAAQALEKRAVELLLINDIGGKIAAVLELDRVLSRAAHLVQQSFGYHHVGLFTLDAEQGKLMMRAKAGDFAHLYPADHRLKLGQGVVGWAGMHGEKLLANDVDAEPRYVNLYPDLIPTRSELCVPIQIGHQIVGVLDVQSPQRDAFDENDVMVIETVADQIAVALDNARLFEEAQRELAERERAEAALRRHTAQLEALRQVGLELTAQLELDKLLLSIVSRAVELLEGNGGGINLYRPDLDLLEWDEPAGVNIGYGTTSLQRGEGVAGKVWETGEPVIVNNYQHWEGQVPNTRLDRFPFTAVVGVPVRWADDFLGVLVVVAETPGTFSPTDAELLSLFATQAAIAIQNARLYTALQEHAGQLELRVRERTAEIQAQYARLQAILRSTTDGIIVTDVAGEILQTNPVSNTWLTRTLSPRDAARLRKAVRELAIQAERLPTMSLELAGLDLELKAAAISEPRPDETLQSDLDELAHAAQIEPSVVVVVHDVSRFKALDRLKTSFITNVSHQLRTPVANIKLYVNLLQKGRQPEKIERYVQVLESQADQLTHLIQDILDITTLDSGQAITLWEPLSLSLIVGDAITRYQSRAEASGLTLSAVRVPRDLPPVMGELSWLIQALGEVVENAIIFASEGGQISIETGSVGDGGRLWVTIAVRDTGPGIPAEEQPRVFDRFYRGWLAESGKIPGTGLGLSIVQGILYAHGGRVTVESQVGAGSMFTLWLPVSKD